jgi:prophage DNA circulation protein
MTILRDVWRERLLPASYFGIRIDVLATDDEWRSSLVRQSGPRRHGARLDPMGQEPRTTRCTIIFFERDPIDGEEDLEDHIERFTAFMRLATEATEPGEFVHPLYGSFQALVEDLSARAVADEPNVIMVQASFIEDAGPDAAAYPEVAPIAAGQGQVNALADELDAQLAGVALPASATAALTVGSNARGLVDSWVTDDKLATRDVNAELSAFSDQVNDALNNINAGTDLSRFPIVRTMHRLHATLRRSAEEFRRSQPQVITHTVQAATSVRALATALYGASGSEAGTAEILRLNDIADPTYLPIGTTVRVLGKNPTGVLGVRGLRGGATR